MSAIEDRDIVECIGLVRGELMDDQRADAADAQLMRYRAAVDRVPGLEARVAELEAALREIDYLLVNDPWKIGPVVTAALADHAGDAADMAAPDGATLEERYPGHTWYPKPVKVDADMPGKDGAE